MTTGITNLGAFRSWIKNMHGEALQEVVKEHRKVHKFSAASIRRRTRVKTGKARASWEEINANPKVPGESAIGSALSYILSLEFGRINDEMVWMTMQEAKKRFAVEEIIQRGRRHRD
jgi:hypothetical protein